MFHALLEVLSSGMSIFQGLQSDRKSREVLVASGKLQVTLRHVLATFSIFGPIQSFFPQML